MECPTPLNSCNYLTSSKSFSYCCRWLVLGVSSSPGSNVFQRATLRNFESPWDEALGLEAFIICIEGLIIGIEIAVIDVVLVLIDGLLRWLRERNWLDRLHNALLILTHLIHCDCWKILHYYDTWYKMIIITFLSLLPSLSLFLSRIIVQIIMATWLPVWPMPRPLIIHPTPFKSSIHLTISITMATPQGNRLKERHTPYMCTILIGEF